MSYERQNSMDRLGQYRARQVARMEAMSRAVDEGRTRVVSSNEPQQQPTAAKAVNGRKSPVTINLVNLGRGNGVLAKPSNEPLDSGKLSPTAKSVSSAFKPEFKVRNATAIRPQHGEVFIYNAETGELERQNVKVKTPRFVSRGSKRQKQFFSSVIATGETVVATANNVLARTPFKK